ncbi:MAG: tRNA (adenosine(37)-N6)-dimethylallyltransferase MiaA [Gammaproteobacteria bacterium]
MHSKPVVFLMGPTASGKTDLAAALVHRLPCEIISVDSAMVYRQMDIGTAKPDSSVLAVAPHRLIDIRDPAEPYSAAEFRRDALEHIRQIHAVGRIPLLVGGTMLYFRALREGLSALPPADPAVRERLSREAEERGWKALHQRLASRDPVAAARIHPNDPQRIQRALEVYELTGEPMSHLQAAEANPPFPFPYCQIALVTGQRTLLHQRIERRFDQMLERGFVEEVERLRARGDLTLEQPALRAVGYRQVWEYLAGKIGREEMRYRGIVATRQLAKRQFTWLRSTPMLDRFDFQDKNLLDKVLKTLESRLTLD